MNLKIFLWKKDAFDCAGVEPRSFDCRSTPQTTELHRRPTSPSPQEDLPFKMDFRIQISFSNRCLNKETIQTE